MSAPSDLIQRALRACPADLAIELDAANSRDSLYEFGRRAWRLVEPSPLVDGRHLHELCVHLEAVFRGEILRLLITMPPRHGKSLWTSVLWPAWIWTHDPTWRSVFASYSDRLATEHSRLMRMLVESAWYRERFSDADRWALADDQNAKDYYRTTRNGHRYSSGITGALTGQGGELVAVDDPLAVANALSEAHREEAKRIVGKVLPTRLNDPNTGRMVMIQQRLHEDDPAAFVLAGGNWEHLNLMSEFERDRAFVTYRTVRAPLRTLEGGTEPEPAREKFRRDWRTVEGELLFPQQFPQSALDALKASDALGLDGFAAQHQQRPSPAGGGMFKIADWRFWKPDGAAPDHFASRPSGAYDGPANPLPRQWDRVILSVDATFKKTTAGSFVAIHVWGAAGARRCLLDRVHERMDFDETVKALLGVICRWPDAREKVIEAKANGDAIMSTLANAHGVTGLIAENPGTENKEQRAAAMLPYQRAGNVELPDGAPWLGDYIGEHALFPVGRYNDDVDAQSQALRHLEREMTAAELIMRMNL